MRLILDASLAVKLVTEEEGSAQVRAGISGATLVAPELLIGEVANALWKKVRQGLAEAEDAAAGLRLMAMLFEPLEKLGPLAERAFGIAVAHQHPVYDCFYVALALRDGTPLATADRRLAKLAVAEGAMVKALLPPQPSSSA